jgi:hypothetical protein
VGLSEDFSAAEFVFSALVLVVVPFRFSFAFGLSPLCSLLFGILFITVSLHGVPDANVVLAAAVQRQYEEAVVELGRTSASEISTVAVAERVGVTALSFHALLLTSLILLCDTFRLFSYVCWRFFDCVSMSSSCWSYHVIITFRSAAWSRS